MTASWWQTLLLAGIGAVLPILWAISNGGPAVTVKVAVSSVLYAVLVAGSNILRSPRANPPTMIKKNPDVQP